MRLGKAWIVIESSIHSSNTSLISVISPKRASSFIRAYLEHIYVDKYASFSEKIAYKKHPRKSPHRIEDYECSSTIVSCGHDPIFRAYLCHKLIMKDDFLTYKYRVMNDTEKNQVENEYCGKVKLA